MREETFAADADDAFGVVFSHDGQFLTVPAANSDTVALWSVPEHRIKHRLEGHRARLSAVAFSGDDQLLATCGNDGEVRLW